MGKSYDLPDRKRPPKVHPHGRGEKRQAPRDRHSSTGSPPRAWGKESACRSYATCSGFTPTGVGKRFCLYVEWRHGRFTPTGVGKRVTEKLNIPPVAVHPHGRGEKAREDREFVAGPGSPPRAWGKAAASSNVSRSQRFTPTGVGKSNPCQLGKYNGRFTPTGVGKSSMPRANRVDSAVHPHGRGEKAWPPCATAGRVGSPPRAWGKGRRYISRFRGLRFTPTGVGKSCPWRHRSPARAVHPHGRGEKELENIMDIAREGSPPRAWGKEGKSDRVHCAYRFTPTGVGKRGVHVVVVGGR